MKMNEEEKLKKLKKYMRKKMNDINKVTCKTKKFKQNMFHFCWGASNL